MEGRRGRFGRCGALRERSDCGRLCSRRVVGAIEGGSLPHGTDLACPSTERIAATTKSFQLDGRQSLSILVPRTSRDGSNNVEVHVVKTSGSAVQLLRLGGTVVISLTRSCPWSQHSCRGIQIETGRLDRVEASVVENGTFASWMGSRSSCAARVDQRRVLFSAGHRYTHRRRTLPRGTSKRPRKRKDCGTWGGRRPPNPRRGG